MIQSPFSLSQKTILVTGASSGIGRACAIAIATMGGTVILTARREQELNETMSQMPGTGHIVLPADQTNQNSRDELVKNLPELDGIVLCAGKIEPFPIKFLTEQKINDLMQLNYYSTVLLIAQLLRQKKLKENSSLVFISSFGAHHTYKGGAIYASSKLALEGFSQVLAQETEHLRIRTNCLAPAMVKTDVFDLTAQQISEEQMDKHIKGYSLGVGCPADVANAAVFLLSPASRWITGQTLFLDGGLNLKS